MEVGSLFHRVEPRAGTRVFRTDKHSDALSQFTSPHGQLSLSYKQIGCLFFSMKLKCKVKPLTQALGMWCAVSEGTVSSRHDKPPNFYSEAVKTQTGAHP